MRNYEELTTNQLLKEFNNVMKTYYSAGGHHKADMNKLRGEQIKAELMERGEQWPEDLEAAKKGTFNGEGSY